jgi:hypothetical protein
MVRKGSPAQPDVYYNEERPRSHPIHYGNMQEELICLKLKSFIQVSLFLTQVTENYIHTFEQDD